LAGWLVATKEEKLKLHNQPFLTLSPKPSAEPFCGKVIAELKAIGHRSNNELLLGEESMESICRQIEEHLLSLHRLVNDVNDIGNAILCSNRRNSSTSFNHAFRVSVGESDVDKLIAKVVRYYESMGLNPCFGVSPMTRPPTFANSLLKAGFERALEEDAMVYRGNGRNLEVNSEAKVAVDDGSLTDVWTDVSMKGFGVPMVRRDAWIAIYGKANRYEGTKSYLGYFQGKPAGTCSLVSINNVGGIFFVATAPEYRRKGVATALLHKAIADSLTMGNSLLYLTTTKGSDAERLYTSVGFEVAYTNCHYERQSQNNSEATGEKRAIE
jgi:GNAT superfamily N-acetyltransferase